VSRGLREALGRWREQITLVPPMETLAVISRHLGDEKPAAYLRFGDGDVRLLAGADDVLQRGSPALTVEMEAAFLLDGPGLFKAMALDCPAFGMQPGMKNRLFGMPDAEALRMLRHAGRCFVGQEVYSHSALAYLSVFRPQAAVDFLLKLKSHRPLFVGNEYTPPALIQTLFGHTGHVATPGRDAYEDIDRIEAEVLRFLRWGRAYPVVVLAMGCGGRVLARRLIRGGFNGFIFDFGSLIDALAGAQTRDWIRLAPHDPRQIFDLNWPRSTPAPYVPKPNHRGCDRPVLNVRWEGPQLLHHSFAVINRELCIQLARQPGIDLTISPLWPHQFTPDSDERFSLLHDRFFQPLAGPADVTVRHKPWPDFVPPEAGHWVTIQPWEYANIPEGWIPHLQDEVDEVWVHSRFVFDCYVRGGLAPDRLQYVPLGVNPRLFRPDAAPMALGTRKGFKFLFVGGTQWRKGTDILLKAYHKAFRARDDVCLVIKDLGRKTFYRGASYDRLLADLQRRPNAPQVLLLDSLFSDADLAGLYAACDCYVHPYRAEGFGLPIAEAMACGLPVLVTDRGPSLDFVAPGTGYLLPSRIMHMEKYWKGVSSRKVLIEYAEPDEAALIERMRHAMDHPDEAHKVGAAASTHIRLNWTWERAAQAVLGRFEALKEAPIRRSPLLPPPNTTS
jgi:glycosyltransferase involved in cell wall biosynthesis